MGIDGSGQSVVEELLQLQHTAGEIDSLHHAASGQDTQHSVEVCIVRLDCFLQGVRKRLPAAAVYLKTLQTNNLSKERHLTTIKDNTVLLLKSVCCLYSE